MALSILVFLKRHLQDVAISNLFMVYLPKELVGTIDSESTAGKVQKCCYSVTITIH